MQNDIMFVKWLGYVREMLMQELRKNHNFICLEHFDYFLCEVCYRLYSNVLVAIFQLDDVLVV